jgi:hypothetical protein
MIAMGERAEVNLHDRLDNHFHEKAQIVKGRRGDLTARITPKPTFHLTSIRTLSGYEPGARWCSIQVGAAISLTVCGFRPTQWLAAVAQTRRWLDEDFKRSAA